MPVFVQDILEELKLSVVCGEDFLKRPITRDVLSRPAVELYGGFFDFYEKNRIQIIGSKEAAIIKQLAPAQRKKVVEELFAGDPPAFIFTGHAEYIFPEFRAASKKYQIPILRSSVPTTTFMGHLTNILADGLATKKRLHGVMLEVGSVGVLLMGRSSIGKSETALELIKRGGTLISDDSIEVYQKEEGLVMAKAPQLIERLMEIRGIGLIDIVDLFGVNAFKPKTKVSLVIKLEKWDQEVNYSRLDTEGETYQLFDTKVPMITIPVQAGRNIATVIEIAVMNWRLKQLGRNAAKTFMEKQGKIVRQEDEDV